MRSTALGEKQLWHGDRCLIKSLAGRSCVGYDATAGETPATRGVLDGTKVQLSFFADTLGAAAVSGDEEDAGGLGSPADAEEVVEEVVEGGVEFAGGVPAGVGFEGLEEEG